jgi:predicted nucleic acid-binding protein
MTAAVFVDTNVLLYARDQGEPVKRVRAKAWLDHLWRQRLGRTSIQVLSEFYYNATRKLHPGMTSEDAWGRIQTYFAWGPQPVDQALLARAYEVEQRYRLSWWDSMVVAAAQLQDCEVLLTADLQDGVVFGSVTVRSPFTLDVREPTAAYAVAPAATPRHRPRGRPKRPHPGPPL